MSALQQASPQTLPPLAHDWFDDSFYGDLGPTGRTSRSSDDRFTEWESAVIANDLERYLDADR